MQTAFQILVAGSPEKLSADVGDKWDSGKIRSDRNINAPYAGCELASAEKCWWKVRAWDAQGQPGPWSVPATFEMGLLKPSDWHGAWITVGKVSSPLFRKEFKLDAPVKRARIYVCGLGYNELYLNGVKADDRVMDPAPTWYDNILPQDIRSRVFYTTYNVTDLLKPGQNAIGVMLGNGWYSCDRERHAMRLTFPGGPVLLLQINMELADGKTVSLATDETWKTSSGPITANDLTDGEHYDARLEQPGWNAAGFKDSTWASATLAKAPSGKLVAQPLEPIRVTRRFKPTRVLKSGDNAYIFDMGQYISGWVELRVHGPAGTKVVLEHAGRVNYDTGKLDTRNSNSSLGFWAALQTDSYTLKGEGVEVWSPRFTIHGFRYVEVRGYPGAPTVADVTGCAVNTDIEIAGEFVCSNELLNRIHHNVWWTFFGSFQGQPQDAADRAERVGWLGDPGFVAEDIMFNFRDVRFWSKWLDDIADSQTPEGQVSYICPPYFAYGQYEYWPCWECTYALYVWFVYLYNDDVRILEKHFDCLRKQVAWFGSKAENHIIVKEPLGDHMEPREDGSSTFQPQLTPAKLTGTAYYQRTARIVAQAAAILGRHDDAREYGRLAEDIRVAFNKEFFNPETNQYATGSQTSNALALYLDLAPSDRVEAVLDNLVKDIDKRGGRLSTGIIGTDALEQTLPRYGRADVMFRIATQTVFPSWGYGVAHGQTTIGECFECNSVYSLSMKMLGSIEKFFYKNLAGISPASPGWKTIAVAPTVVGDLTWAKASFNSFHGRIAVEWQRKDSGVTIKVAIPVNTTAIVTVPKLNLSNELITEGDQPVWKSGRFLDGVTGVTKGHETENGVVLTIGSGIYEFTLQNQENSR
ncbi:MAG: family 78 glycoside hydrolase catalytic domain [Kiritimatiellaeota bacterium]|nr:family 78 glycoside hydrolase catalytic domain [Kiritimatiellota bacterium]